MAISHLYARLFLSNDSAYPYSLSLLLPCTPFSWLVRIGDVMQIKGFFNRSLLFVCIFLLATDVVHNDLSRRILFWPLPSTMLVQRNAKQKTAEKNQCHFNSPKPECDGWLDG